MVVISRHERGSLGHRSLATHAALNTPPVALVQGTYGRPSPRTAAGLYDLGLAPACTGGKRKRRDSRADRPNQEASTDPQDTQPGTASRTAETARQAAMRRYIQPAAHMRIIRPGCRSDLLRFTLWKRVWCVSFTDAAGCLRGVLRHSARGRAAAAARAFCAGRHCTRPGDICAGSGVGLVRVC